ncbi:ATP-binding cassette domain-containing protein, partial [Nocardioides sp. GCM10030258]
LEVRQSLEFSARLRLPSGTTEGERDRRVEEVISQVGLDRLRGHRIGSQLSGGQRKRVSIATELLTAPPLLFLDEPTSGLDPGMDRSVMQELRGLAEAERVVVVSTHSVLGLETCDNVVVLARGGRVVHVGPPDGLLDHFGVPDHPALFDLLDSSTSQLRHTEAKVRTPIVGAAPVRPVSRSAQVATLIRRNVALLRADRLHLGMLVLMPLVLAGLSRLVQGAAGLSLHVAERVPGGAPDGTELTQRLTLLVIAASLMGAAMTVRELVGERAIFRREYAVGLSPGAYVASKAVVLGLACFGQGVLVTWLSLLGLPEQDHGGGVRGWGWWEIALPIGLLAAVMALAGLCVSAAVRTVEQTAPALVGLVMSQIVLASALVQFAGRPVLEQLSWLAPSRWAYAAMASSTDQQRTLQGAPDAARDPLWSHGVAEWDHAVLALAAAGVILWLVLLRTVRRSRSA